jgi:hypothetical protein
MKFRAEQFEAEVTEVGEHQWVIQAQGQKAKTIRVIGDACQVLTDRGWAELCAFCEALKLDEARPRWLRADLADAIALLYSVPGVVYVDERALPSEVMGPSQRLLERHRVLSDFVEAGYISEELADTIKKVDILESQVGLPL